MVVCVYFCVYPAPRGRRCMATNLNLDDKLVAEAKRLGGHATKREAVNKALLDYVRRKKRRKILALAGRVEWSADYDYKKERRRR